MMIRIRFCTPIFKDLVRTYLTSPTVNGLLLSDLNLKASKKQMAFSEFDPTVLAGHRRSPPGYQLSGCENVTMKPVSGLAHSAAVWVNRYCSAFQELHEH